MKNFTLLAAVATMTSMLAGCELYFSGHDDSSDHWNYCGSDGYYDCSGDQCTWESSTCPSDGMTGSGGSGYECTSNTDCAAGCYCADGTCNEAGFCSSDKDCGTGYHCDVDRSSCEPNPPAPTCGADTDCASGTVCTDGACTATCTCATDADATAAGFGWCDETRGTCENGADPAGDCGGTLTCNDKEPSCPDGSTALIANGCYTGECRTIASCQTAPSCSDLEHEDDCLNRASDCSATYTGLNCHTPTGGACHAGDTNCTCASFNFASCDGRTPPVQTQKTTTDSAGRKIPLTSDMFSVAN